MTVDKSQFKKLAEIILAVERSVIALNETGEGMPVAAVGLLVTKVGMTRIGAAALVSMINQSDVVRFSECGEWLIMRPQLKAVIDVEAN